VAELIREGPRPTQPALNRYWQALPGVLEDLHSHLESQAAERQHEREQHQQALETLYRSNSFKLTAPLRHLRRTLNKWLGALRHD
jgi:lipopolysaccharide transport system ATP-binding protein